MLLKTLFRTVVNYRNINKNGNSGDNDDNHIPHEQHILKILMLLIWLKALILQIYVS